MNRKPKTVREVDWVVLGRSPFLSQATLALRAQGHSCVGIEHLETQFFQVPAFTHEKVQSVRGKEWRMRTWSDLDEDLKKFSFYFDYLKNSTLGKASLTKETESTVEAADVLGEFSDVRDWTVSNDGAHFSCRGNFFHAKKILCVTISPPRFDRYGLPAVKPRGVPTGSLIQLQLRSPSLVQSFSEFSEAVIAWSRTDATDKERAPYLFSTDGAANFFATALIADEEEFSPEWVAKRLKKIKSAIQNWRELHLLAVDENVSERVSVGQVYLATSPQWIELDAVSVLGIPSFTEAPFCVAVDTQTPKPEWLATAPDRVTPLAID